MAINESGLDLVNVPGQSPQTEKEEALEMVRMSADASYRHRDRGIYGI